MVGPTQFHWEGVDLIPPSAGFPAQFFEPSFGLLEGDHGYDISYMIAYLYLLVSSPDPVLKRGKGSGSGDS